MGSENKFLTEVWFVETLVRNGYVTLSLQSGVQACPNLTKCAKEYMCMWNNYNAVDPTPDCFPSHFTHFLKLVTTNLLLSCVFIHVHYADLDIKKYGDRLRKKMKDVLTLRTSSMMEV